MFQFRRAFSRAEKKDQQEYDDTRAQADVHIVPYDLPSRHVLTIAMLPFSPSLGGVQNADAPAMFFNSICLFFCQIRKASWYPATSSKLDWITLIYSAEIRSSSSCSLRFA